MQLKKRVENRAKIRDSRGKERTTSRAYNTVAKTTSARNGCQFEVREGKKKRREPQTTTENPIEPRIKFERLTLGEGNKKITESRCNYEKGETPALEKKTT